MRPARFETSASADAFLRQAGVDHLPHDHPDRKKALRNWSRTFLHSPNPEAYKHMAAKDPNRLGAPKGWKGVV